MLARENKQGTSNVSRCNYFHFTLLITINDTFSQWGRKKGGVISSSLTSYIIEVILYLNGLIKNTSWNTVIGILDDLVLGYIHLNLDII